MGVLTDRLMSREMKGNHQSRANPEQIHEIAPKLLSLHARAAVIPTRPEARGHAASCFVTWREMHGMHA